ncbi:MAG: alpha/beta hydrolase family protein [Telluria sp.]
MKRLAWLWFLCLACAAPAAPAAASDAAPAASAAYRESELTLGHGKFAVGATLTLPAGPGPFPAVVLVHGSGPGMRDMKIGGSYVFRDIAHGLAERGIASIRYDKRTTAHKQEFRDLGRPGTFDEEYIADATRAAIVLQDHPKVDPGRIYIIGHSQGAGLAPHIANNVIARGAVLVAGTARSPADVIFDQGMHFLKTANGNPEAIANANEVLEVAGKLRHLDRLNPDDKLLGMPLWYWKGSEATRSPESIDALLNRGGRVLLVQGGRDWRVTDADFAVWKKLFPAGGAVSYLSYPKLNHLM